MRFLKKYVKIIEAAMIPPEKPIEAHEKGKQHEILKTWENHLKSDPALSGQAKYIGHGRSSAFGETSYKSGHSGQEYYDYVYMYVANPRKSGYTYGETMKANLFFDQSGRLVVGPETSTKARAWPIGDKSDLVRYCQAILQCYEDVYAEEKKKQKIRDLKAGGILAHLKAIAEEDGFEYDHRRNTQRITLYVKLSERNMLTVAVPFGKFQEIMQEMRPIIQLGREMASKGILFQIGPHGRYHSWKKASPEP